MAVSRRSFVTETCVDVRGFSAVPCFMCVSVQGVDDCDARSWEGGWEGLKGKGRVRRISCCCCCVLVWLIACV